MKNWMLGVTIAAVCLNAGGGISARAYSAGELEYRIEGDDTVSILRCRQDAQGAVAIPAEIDGFPVTRLEPSAFDACTAVTEVTIPDSVTAIGAQAFRGCAALETVVLPDSVQSLGAYAFEDCAVLDAIELPDGVCALENGILDGCSGLRSLRFSEKTEQIGAYFAQNCTSLTELTVPAAVTDIGDYAFRGCTGLTDVTFEGGAPAVGTDSFEADTVVLHYPSGAQGWTQPLWNGYQTQEESGLTGIVLSQTELSMDVGESVTLTASPVPENVPLTGLSWTSSAPNIVSVQNGTLTAHSEGTAAVTAASGTVSAQCQVTVHDPSPQEVVLSSTSLSMYAGDTAQLTAQVAPESAAGTEILWTSSNEQVASVQNGLVTAAGGGTAQITASAGQAQAVCTVTVGLRTPVLLPVQADCLSVTVSWEPVTGAEQYRILRKTTGEWQTLASVSGQTYTDTTGTYGTQYYYTVQAVGGTAQSEYDAAGVGGRRLLGQPVLTGVSAPDDQTAHVSWEPVSGADSYRVYRKSGSSGWARIAELSGTDYNDTGLTCGMQYTYTVRALWGETLSSYDTAGISVTPVPPAPVLDEAQSGFGKVTIRWKPVARADTYRVYRRLGSSDWQRLAVLSSGTLSYEDTTAEEHVIYQYTVRADRTVDGQNVVGRYDRTGVNGCTRPRAPEQLSAQALDTGNRISWQRQNGVTGYRVYRRTEGGSWSRIAVIRNAGLFLDETAQPGETYDYTVQPYIIMGDRLVPGDYDRTGVRVTTAS